VDSTEGRACERQLSTQGRHKKILSYKHRLVVQAGGWAPPCFVRSPRSWQTRFAQRSPCHLGDRPVGPFGHELCDLWRGRRRSLSRARSYPRAL